MPENPKPGQIGWMDLTVDDGAGIRDFYCAVAGWEASAVSLGDYEDYCVGPPGEEPVGGICHARGENAGLPAKWLIYIVVTDIHASLAQCEANGGRVVQPVRGAGGGSIAVIEDPAGAVCALYQAAE